MRQVIESVKALLCGAQVVYFGRTDGIVPACSVRILGQRGPASMLYSQSPALNHPNLLDVLDIGLSIIPAQRLDECFYLLLLTLFCLNLLGLREIEPPATPAKYRKHIFPF